eukprot:2683771-Rhodomonas_salina.1
MEADLSGRRGAAGVAADVDARERDVRVKATGGGGGARGEGGGREGLARSEREREGGGGGGEREKEAKERREDVAKKRRTATVRAGKGVAVTKTGSKVTVRANRTPVDGREERAEGFLAVFAGSTMRHEIKCKKARPETAEQIDALRTQMQETLVKSELRLWFCRPQVRSAERTSPRPGRKHEQKTACAVQFEAEMPGRARARWALRLARSNPTCFPARGRRSESWWEEVEEGAQRKVGREGEKGGGGGR